MDCLFLLLFLLLLSLIILFLQETRPFPFSVHKIIFFLFFIYLPTTFYAFIRNYYISDKLYQFFVNT